MASSQRVGRDKQSTWAQKAAILEWLEVKENFNVITGSAAFNCPVVAGKKLKKVDAYKCLADYVSGKCGTHWDAKTSQARYRSYLKLFKKTLRQYKDVSGEKFCLSQADFKRGITTIDMKLESLCYGFKRMDLLFGSRQNLNPYSVLQPGSDFNDHDDDDEDDDEDDEDEEEQQRQSWVDTTLAGCANMYLPAPFTEETQPEETITSASISPSGRPPLAPSTIENLPVSATKARKTSVLSVEELASLSKTSVSASDVSDNDSVRSVKKKKTSDFNTIFQESNREKISLENEKFAFQCRVYGEEFILKKMDCDERHKNNQREFNLKQLEFEHRNQEFATTKQMKELEIEKAALLAKELKQMDIVKEMRLELMRNKYSPAEINDFIAQMFGTYESH
jgi:hypothetical protein